MLWMNPGRDIAVSFPGLAIRTIQVMQNPQFRGNQWFYAHGGTDKGLHEAARVLENYVNVVVENADNKQTLNDAIVYSGYFELADSAKLLIGTAFYQVVMAAYFHGYRELMIGKAMPPIDFETLQAVSRGSKRAELKRYIFGLASLIWRIIMRR